MAKKYGVSVPIAGYIYLEVEAESAQEAIDQALQMPWEDQDIEELDSYERIIQGNVCYLYHTRADAQEINN